MTAICHCLGISITVSLQAALVSGSLTTIPLHPGITALLHHKATVQLLVAITKIMSSKLVATNPCSIYFIPDTPKFGNNLHCWKFFFFKLLPLIKWT